MINKLKQFIIPTLPQPMSNAQSLEGINKALESFTLYLTNDTFVELNGKRRTILGTYDIKNILYPINQEKLEDVIASFKHGIGTTAVICITYNNIKTYLEMDIDKLRAYTNNSDLHKAQAIEIYLLSQEQLN